jgi:hypothetical protein
VLREENGMATEGTVVERPQPPLRRRNGAGTAALVTGVVALVLAVLVIFFPLAGLLGIIAAILGAVGMKRASRNEADNRGHAVAGLVCGLLALVLAVTFSIRLTTFIADHQGDFRRFWTCITSAPTETQQSDCAEQLARSLES